MSSILTNVGAMVALQNLQSINKNLAGVQSEISTGKAISNAKDNSAVWAISKVMESDVAGFKAIQSSLSLGESTVSVARQASETVTDLLTQMKDKVVAAQEQNVDRSKIGTDIAALKSQIESVVGAAQFNGLNLLNGSREANNSNGNAGVDVLSSLDRDSNGNVSAAQIGVDAQNLSSTAGTELTATATFAPTVIRADNGAAGGPDEVTLSAALFLDDANATTGGVAIAKDTAGLDQTTDGGLIEGDSVSLTIGDVTGSYVVKVGDTGAEVMSGLRNGLVEAGLDTEKFTLDLTTAGELTVVNTSNDDGPEDTGIAVSYQASRGDGGLSALNDIDVSTDSDAAASLTAIENMIQTSIDAAAAFGSAQTRIETQSDFVSSLTDSLKAGIGTLVDANMEEASARLQALQVQQQLGVQSLSIANQAPQSLLSLFR